MSGKYLVYLQRDDGSWYYFNKYETEEGARRGVADFLIGYRCLGWNVSDKVIKIRCADGHVSYYDRDTLIKNRNKSS